MGPKASKNAVDAIEAMLEFSPVARKDVEGCLVLPYFSALHMPDDEPTAEKPIDWQFDKFTPTKRLLQNYIYVECAKFHSDIIQRDSKLLASREILDILKK